MAELDVANVIGVALLCYRLCDGPPVRDWMVSFVLLVKAV